MQSSEYWELAQALLFAACTWYVRRGSKFDSVDVKINTASVDQVQRLQAQVALLREDVGLLKDRYFEQNPVVDDRGPSNQK